MDYAIDHVITNLPIKEVFHVWFQYGTKCNHTTLVNCCVKILAKNFQVGFVQMTFRFSLSEIFLAGNNHKSRLGEGMVEFRQRSISRMSEIE